MEGVPGSKGHGMAKTYKGKAETYKSEPKVYNSKVESEIVS